MLSHGLYREGSRNNARTQDRVWIGSVLKPIFHLKVLEPPFMLLRLPLLSSILSVIGHAVGHAVIVWIVARDDLECWVLHEAGNDFDSELVDAHLATAAHDSTLRNGIQFR